MAPVALDSQRWGHGQRRVLLVHGHSSNGMTWWRVASELAGRGLEAVAPDLRGHGSSPRALSYSVSELASDLLLLGGGWDVAVGHSLGGLVVATAAVPPGFARGLVLIDPALAIPEESYEDAKKALMAELYATEEEIAALHPSWHPQDVEIKATAVRMASRWAMERCLDENAPWDHLGVLGALRVPTVVVGAGIDPLFTSDHADAARQAGARFQFVVATGAGHSVHREDPAVVVEAVMRLLE